MDKSNAIFNLSNNFITIGKKRPKDFDASISKKVTDSIDYDENILTVEVMNELLHLPYDTVLLPFLKKVGVPTSIRDCDGVIDTGVLNLNGGYLNPNFKNHQNGYSVQPDTTIILKDYVVYFEFKKPLSTPSSNLHSIKDMGRQTLLAYKDMQKYDISDYMIIMTSNCAPKVYISNEGLVYPQDVIDRYFNQNIDKWMMEKFISKIADTVDINKAKKSFIVCSWVEIIDYALNTIEEAKNQYSDKNIIALLLKSESSIKWFKERRKKYFDKYKTDY